MREPTDLELERLTSAAVSWIGTPFCANSGTKGAGVCCHAFVALVYEEAGWTPRLSFPPGPPVWSRAARRSLMEDWLDGDDGRKHFTRTNCDSIRPGDLLGFKVGTCVHHLAVLLPSGIVAHASHPHGAAVAPISALPSAWASRLAAAWRPILK